MDVSLDPNFRAAPLTLVEPTRLPPSASCRAEGQSARTSRLDMKVSGVALRTLAKVTVTLAADAVVFHFFGAPIVLTVVAAGLAGATVAWGMEAVTRLARRPGTNPKGNSDSENQQMEKALSTLSTGALATTACNGGTGIALHEAGHALAAKACFQNASPIITISPFQGGLTQFSIESPLTRFGKMLGANGAVLLITVAGIAATTLTAMAAFSVAGGIQDNHPALSQFLTAHGVAQIASDVIYGLSTFAMEEMSLAHDFFRLWVVGGIHPLLPISLMIALPLVQAVAIAWFRSVPSQKNALESSNAPVDIKTAKFA